MNKMKAAAAALALVLTLAVPVMANAATTSYSYTGRVTTSSTTQTVNTSPLKWLADQIALTKLNLSPTVKKFVNALIKQATPVLCPLIAKLADPNLASFVQTACLQIGQSADPWKSLQDFTPILCANPAAIFPNYAKLFSFACGFLV